MADSSSSNATIADKVERSDVDLEKGAYEPNSDLEAATIVPDGEKGRPEETDPNVVSWDGPDDPENPMNWTNRKKWSNIAVLSILTIITCVTALSSSTLSMR